MFSAATKVLSSNFTVDFLILGLIFSRSFPRLFNDDELAVVDRFRGKGGGGLSLDARRLYVRLFERKFDWIRREKINYGGKEVGDEDGALRELEEAGFLRTGRV